MRRMVLPGFLLVAALASAVVVHRPMVVLLLVGAAVAAALVLANVEAMVLLLIAVAPFEAYLRALNGNAVKLLGALVVLAWAFRAVRSGGIRLNGKVPAALAALLVCVLLSTVVHDNGSEGLTVLSRYVSFLLIGFVLVDTARTRLPPQRMAQVFVLGCTAAAVVGSANSFVSGDGRASGPLDDPNDLAYFFVAALPLAAALGLRARHRTPYAVAVVVLLFGTATTLSRGAAIAIGCIVLLALSQGLVKLRWLVAVGLATALAIGSLFVLAPSLVHKELYYKSNVAGQNVDDRLVRWKAAAEMTLDSPLVGLGPAGFKENYAKYRLGVETAPLTPLDVSHDMYLEVSSELGLLGLAAFLTMIVGGLIGSVRRWRAFRDPFAFGVVASVLGTCVAAIFLTEQYYLPVWLLAAFGAALDPDEAEIDPVVAAAAVDGVSLDVAGDLARRD